MTPLISINDSDLNAYMDGELDACAIAEVEAWLHDHPEDAARFAAVRADKVALHDLYDPVLEEDVPNEIEQILKQPRPRFKIPTGIWITASVVMLFIGVTAGWNLRGQQGDAPAFVHKAFAERAIGAHVVYASEVRHPVEVGADQETHLVTWLSKRLGTAVKVPDLGERGFSLIGGRLLADESKPAALFMFEDTMGRRVTVYVKAQEGKDTTFRLARTMEANAVYWVNAPLAYVLTGDLGREELLNIANLIYQPQSL
ncbi:MAG: anti-sigma factor [Magnetovibrio sp.]|nr:anti-sigma factor [Magnetovibrio sp.]